MSVHIDEEALQSSLLRPRQAAFDADVAGVMKRAVNAVHDLFGYSGAGVMFITESGCLSYVAAFDEAGRQLEQAQAAAGEGPCYESYVHASEVVSGDLTPTPGGPGWSRTCPRRCGRWRASRSCSAAVPSAP